MYPGVADKENLQPFFDAVAMEIASADPLRLVVFESVTWDDQYGMFKTGYLYFAPRIFASFILSFPISCLYPFN
jgi:hypothetical protein